MRDGRQFASMSDPAIDGRFLSGGGEDHHHGSAGSANGESVDEDEELDLVPERPFEEEPQEFVLIN